MKNKNKLSKLEQSPFFLNFQIHYFLLKIQLIKFQVKSSVSFVKNSKMIKMINLYIVNFVVIQHVNNAAIKKENFINPILLSPTNKIMECAVKFVIENFYKIKLKKESIVLLLIKLVHLNLNLFYKLIKKILSLLDNFIWPIEI